MFIITRGKLIHLEVPVTAVLSKLMCCSKLASRTVQEAMWRVLSKAKRDSRMSESQPSVCPLGRYFCRSLVWVRASPCDV